MEEYNRLDNGTCYHLSTNQQVIDVLEDARKNGTRIRIFYGDAKNGKCWNEENDVTGTIGRSTGEVKVPLLISNKRSTGSGAILDHCIVKIITKTGVLYQHPLFNSGIWSFDKNNVYNNGKLWVSFKKEGKTQRYVDFMTGERFTK